MFGLYRDLLTFPVTFDETAIIAQKNWSTLHGVESQVKNRPRLITSKLLASTRSRRLWNAFTKKKHAWIFNENLQKNLDVNFAIFVHSVFIFSCLLGRYWGKKWAQLFYGALHKMLQLFRGAFTHKMYLSISKLNKKNLTTSNVCQLQE